ncbi:MAG: hypothetical protein Kow0092_35450 [Deferrisomatales bacterium]
MLHYTLGGRPLSTGKAPPASPATAPTPTPARDRARGTGNPGGSAGKPPEAAGQSGQAESQCPFGNHCFRPDALGCWRLAVG